MSAPTGSSVMSLHQQALITFSMPGIWYKEVKRDGHTLDGGETEHRVHVLVAECAPNLHALLVSELSDGDFCADPPVVIYRIMVPDKRVMFKTDEEFYTITITDKHTWRFYLRFPVDHEFWEVARIVVEAKLEEGVRGSQIDDLIRGALDTVPTVASRTPLAPPCTAASLRPVRSEIE